MPAVQRQQNSRRGILHDGKSAISSLATDIQFGRMLSSSYQAQQREAESQVQSLSNSISHGSQLAGSQLTQWAQQRGNSDTVVSGADSSRATTLTQAINKLNSVADSLAKRAGISTSEAVTEVLNKHRVVISLPVGMAKSVLIPGKYSRKSC